MSHPTSPIGFDQSARIDALQAELERVKKEKREWEIKHDIACDTLDAVKSERDEFRKLTYISFANVGDRTKERDEARAELERVKGDRDELKAWGTRTMFTANEMLKDLAQSRAEAASLRAGMERVENALTLLRHIEKRYREVGKTHYDWDKLHADISAIERAVNSTSPSDALSAIKEAMEALEFFNNRRKLAHSLRAESPQIAAFVEDIGQQMDKYDALSKLRKHFGDA